MYIELNHGLVAGKLENINEKTVLEGRKEEKEKRVSKYHFPSTTKYLLNLLGCPSLTWVFGCHQQKLPRDPVTIGCNRSKAQTTKGSSPS